MEGEIHFSNGFFLILLLFRDRSKRESRKTWLIVSSFFNFQFVFLAFDRWKDMWMRDYESTLIFIFIVKKEVVELMQKATYKRKSFGFKFYYFYHHSQRSHYCHHMNFIDFSWESHWDNYGIDPFLLHVSPKY